MPNGQPGAGEPPREIPWQLAASTRTLDLLTQPPVGSSISILTHVPRLETLDQDFPNDRLVYLKVSVSLSPDRRVIEQAMEEDVARLLLSGGPPIWVSVVDVRLSPIPDQEQAITPHFVSASPLRRTAGETGVIGTSNYEGASEGIATGKSGAEIHEAFQSAVTEETSGGGGYVALLPFIAGGGGSTTTTDISGRRDVYQFQDTLTRQAAEERRDLLSHMTRVHNALTLLSGLYVGSPYLKFVLRPRPLRALSIDPNDPNLWQHELLRRRSSGLEGIQDFYSVAVIPRNLEGFCVSVRLRNVYVLDAPPPPLIDDWISFFYDPPNFYEMLEYLTTRYPRGTPADELDVDLIGTGPRSAWLSPSVAGYGALGPNADEGWVVVAIKGIDPGGGNTVLDRYVPYKTLETVWLETRRAAHQEAVSQSPLERGVVTYVPHEVGVCFDFQGDGTLRRRSPTIRMGDTPMIPSYEEDFPGGPGTIGRAGGGLPRQEARRNWARWANLEDELVARASNTGDWGDTKLDLQHPRMFDAVLRALSQLPAGRAANVPLSALRQRYGLTNEQIKALKDAGIRDLRGLAQAVRLGNRLTDALAFQEELSRQQAQQRKASDALKAPVPASPEVLNAVRAALASALARKDSNGHRKK
ncbi:MAG TPA: hypothetical protein VFQ79_21635 [Bryobacteraceae bacterium]|nr:hypothetical protein [Bryobacteraceae bacterium]